MLGVGFGPPAQGETSIARVQTVLPGTTAETMGVKVGDQIVSVGGKPVSTVPEVVAYAGTLRADAAHPAPPALRFAAAATPPSHAGGWAAVRRKAYSAPIATHQASAGGR